MIRAKITHRFRGRGKHCNGKRLIDDIYREYRVRHTKFDFKRRLAKRMKNEQSEDWTLVKSKLRDAMAGEAI